jgi:hypothetical protein
MGVHENVELQKTSDRRQEVARSNLDLDRTLFVPASQILGTAFFTVFGLLNRRLRLWE